MPNYSFQAKGFEFKAGIRSKGSKSYLSSVIVTDQLFIGVNPEKPAKGSPDLRVTVNNPFSGKRFNENDILYLDKKRLYQIRLGSYNSTRFDRLMEDFSFQYIKKSPDIRDLSSVLSNEVNKVEINNEFLEEAIQDFRQITGIQISLNLIDNYHPFKNANFAWNKRNNQQVRISNLGSGYEMFFSLIYAFHLAKQSGKQLIILIDEPELHMHPALQEKLVSFLLEISKTAQIFMSTHSSLLIKQLASNDSVKIMILKNGCQVASMDERKLPYISSNETNYLAFNMATEEYHNELYEELKYLYGATKGYREFDKEFFVQQKGEKPNSPWKQQQNQVSIHTFIRNQIHHPKENGKPKKEDLRASIERMREFF